MSPATDGGLSTVMGMARTVAGVFGAIYVLLGMVGFVLESRSSASSEVINGLHNIVHIGLGAVLLNASTSTLLAIAEPRRVGAMLVVLGLLGFVSTLEGLASCRLAAMTSSSICRAAILLATGIFEVADELA